MKTSVSSHITVRGIIAYIFGILFALCLILTLLITSVEAVAYWMPEYYENEYRKYQVAETVQMEMEDLLEVTDQMMAYLRGDREDLHITTVVGGQTREFFNDREIAHMEDVRGLFLGGLLLRSLCIRGAGLCLILLAAMRARLSQVLPRSICAGTGLFFLLACILAAVISTDFTRYFTIFHQIFFDNDLWILDPRTDLLINIVPEPFFVDTAARIGLLFGGSVLILFAACFLWLYRQKRNHAAGA